MWLSSSTKKIYKKNILPQVTGGNTPIVVLKRMLGHFQKIPPFKKIFEFQYWRKDYETSTINKIWNQKLNHQSKTQKRFPKYFLDKICKIKQYSN